MAGIFACLPGTGMLLARARPFQRGLSVASHSCRRPPASSAAATWRRNAPRRLKTGSTSTTTTTTTNSAATKEAAEANAINQSNQPPFVVRAMLVGSAVGLATPFLATAGVGLAWFRYKPSSAAGQAFKVGLAVLMGGGGYKLVSEHAWPFFRDHGDLLLPFAVSNAVSSGFWYAVLESAMGISFMAGIVARDKLPGLLSALLPATGVGMPIGGPLVGAVTALSTCFLWSPAIKACWGQEMQEILLGKERDASFLLDVYLHLAAPVALPIGILAGLGAHLLLAPTMLGRIKTPWPNVVVPVVGGILGLSGFYFYGASKGHSVADLFWIVRMDDKTGELYSMNLRDGRVLPGQTSAASKSATTRWTIETLHHLRSRKGTDTTTGAPVAPVLVTTMPEDDSQVSYADLPAREQLLQTVDVLVRAKALELQLQKLNEKGGSQAEKEAIQASQTQLAAFAKDKLQVTDVPGLLQTSELLVALGRKAAAAAAAAAAAPSSTSGSSPGSAGADAAAAAAAAAASREAGENFKEVAESLSKYSLGSGGAEHLRLLGSNLNLLDRDLKQKLDYQISDVKVEVYKKERSIRRALLLVVRLTALYLTVGPLINEISKAFGGGGS